MPTILNSFPKNPPTVGLFSKIVGLTGGIGSGKSQVRRIFESLGVPCWDADIVAREIHQDPSHPAIDKLVERFGDILTTDGKMDRLKMRDRLVVDSAANRDLKDILGHYVIEALQQLTSVQRVPYVVWESALVIEEKIPVDRILVVDCSANTQIERVKLRNPDWSPEHINHMLSLQLCREERLSASDDVIINETTLDDLIRAVEKQHQLYSTFWRK